MNWNRGLQRLSLIVWVVIGLGFTAAGLVDGLHSSNPWGIGFALVSLPLAYSLHRLSCWLVRWVVDGFITE